ncbi:hypothetical protein [Thalassobacillus pellis]|uniref:hypothetical protein n=1 Tax=Thalassobacillus pellis TaxID=748008 RepID=UPI0019608583|nr:hypothetical protein [Thalassobacillus pellis]MBM7552234.1 hypothetical protein [Thalassobacillus pellis]
MYWLLSVVITGALLAGCQNQPGAEPGAGINDPIKVGTAEIVNQDIARNAEKQLKEENHLKDVQAVNDGKKLLIAAQVPHNERFSLKKIEKKMNRQAKKQFPDHEVTLSMDKKIHLEVMELKGKLSEGGIGKKKWKKEIERIIKLSKEKT